VSRAPVIVNFAQIVDGFGEGHEAVAKLTGASQPDRPDDLESAMVMASIQRALGALDEAQVERDVMSSPDDPVAAAVQTVLAEQADKLGTPEPLPAGGREIRFDNYDIRWAKDLMGLVKGRLNIGKFDFLPGPLVGEPIPNKTRIAVLGDWGTNAYGAPHCADAIRADGDFGAAVHLGDVYYSGSDSEVHGRFLAEWPFLPGVVNRACNSNHEMFSGGKPYVNLTLHRFGQSSSLFWLENDHWILLGLDSAYDDGTIGPLQADWVQGICDQARRSTPAKKVVLMSHHQPWRTDSGEEQHLVDPIRPLLEAGSITGWYWGHEHLAALFEPHETWDMWGACIGHSGFPYVRIAGKHRWKQVGDPVADDGLWHAVPSRHGSPEGVHLDGPNPWIPGHESKFGPNGYAVLELDGPQLQETVYTPSGAAIHQRALQ
jgi:hypothetical protein